MINGRVLRWQENMRPAWTMPWHWSWWSGTWTFDWLSGGTGTGKTRHTQD